MISNEDMVSVWRALRSLGIRQVQYRYCGSGDSGSVDAGEVTDAENDLPEQVLQSTYVTVRRRREAWNEPASRWDKSNSPESEPLEEVLAHVAESILDKHHGGWEINEGSEGCVVFDAEHFTATVEHRQFITTHEDSSSTVDLTPPILDQLSMCKKEEEG